MSEKCALEPENERKGHFSNMDGIVNKKKMQARTGRIQCEKDISTIELIEITARRLLQGQQNSSNAHEWDVCVLSCVHRVEHDKTGVQF
jgi:hypothetical protein